MGKILDIILVVFLLGIKSYQRDTATIFHTAIVST